MIHVLVDIDETMLSVPIGINAQTSGVMFREMFKLNAHEEMINNIGKTEMGIIHEILAKFGHADQPVPVEAYKVWADAMEKRLKENPVKRLPGMDEFLNALSKNPKTNLVLLTGNSPWRAEIKLKSAGFDKYFRDKNTGNLKGVFGDMTPRRDELFTLLKNQTRPEDKFVVVDDSLIGAKMARENNLTMIAVETGKAKRTELLKYTPNVFKDFGDNRWKEALALFLA